MKGACNNSCVKQSQILTQKIVRNWVEWADRMDCGNWVKGSSILTSDSARPFCPPPLHFSCLFSNSPWSLILHHCLLSNQNPLCLLLPHRSHFCYLCMQTWFLIGLPNQTFASPWWPSKVSLFKMSPVLPSIICEIWPSSHHSPLTICEIQSFLMALSVTLVTFSLHFLPCLVIPHGNFIELNLMACPSHLSVYLHKLGKRLTTQSHKWWLSNGHWRNDAGKRIRQEDSETLCEQEDVAGWSTNRKDNPQKHANKDRGETGY